MSLADISFSLTFAASIVSKLLTVACVAAGSMLMMTAYANYQIHRRNPKMVPLTTPLSYVLFGILLILVPFLGDLLDIETGDPNPHEHIADTYDVDATAAADVYDIDAY